MRRRRIDGDGHRLPLMRRERWLEEMPSRSASSFWLMLSLLRRSHTASALSITFLAERLPGTVGPFHRSAAAGLSAAVASVLLDE